MTSKKAKPAKQEQSAPRNKAREMTLLMVKGQTEDQAIAGAALSPEMANGSTFADYTKGIFSDIHLQSCIEVMQADIKKVNAGDLSKLEGMLTAQAEVLNAMFNQLAKKSCHATMLPQMEAYMRWALKAQGQCRTTIEAIAEIKFPKSATFIRQANIAGQQQVNNGVEGFATNTHTHAHAQEKTINPANELLSEATHAALDSGRKTAAVGLDQGLETLVPVDRAKD